MSVVGRAARAFVVALAGVNIQLLSHSAEMHSQIPKFDTDLFNVNQYSIVAPGTEVIRSVLFKVPNPSNRTGIHTFLYHRLRF